jgi:hypothetical protein
MSIIDAHCAKSKGSAVATSMHSKAGFSACLDLLSIKPEVTLPTIRMEQL